ncbi:MAG: glycosyltransferase [Bacteroidota bacterium]|nr:glycosyltransferase [Bacteroidota bacterium]
MDNQKEILPLISVILPVYNSEAYIRESIESILNQTYSNFEFLILNDGSKDKSEEIILSYGDPRIKYYKHPNCGLAGTLNRGIELSKGDFIARQDQDDISLPQRFEKQLNFLVTNPDVVMVGTRASVFIDGGKVIKYHDHATDSAVLKFDLMFNNPFVHSSVMFKKSVLEKTGNYTVDRNFFEDYNLWSKMAWHGKLVNLKDVLVEYRHHEKGMSKDAAYFSKNALYNQCTLNIETLMGEKSVVVNDMLALMHKDYTLYRGTEKAEIYQYLQKMAEKIISQHKGSENLVSQRLKQYKNIMGYCFNIYKRKLAEKNRLKMFFLKLDMKLHEYHPNLINE